MVRFRFRPRVVSKPEEVGWETARRKHRRSEAVNRRDGTSQATMESEVTRGGGWKARVGSMFPGPSLLFCVYQFLINFKPSEPHVAPYLVSVKGFTNQQVNHDIFPYLTYTYFLATALSTPAVQLLGYKRVILLGTFCRLFTRLLLLYGSTLWEMQLMQVVYGIANATDLNVVFGAYMFCLIEQKYFQRVVSIAHAAKFLSELISSEGGQILLHLGMSLTLLMYISLIAVSMGTALAFFLPNAESSPSEEISSNKVEIARSPVSMVQWGHAKWNSIRQLYQNFPLLKLSIVWVFASNVYYFIDNYGTILFQARGPDTDMNGHVGAVMCLVASLTSLLATYLEVPALKLGFVFYAIMQAIFTLNVLVTVMFPVLWSSWSCFVIGMSGWNLVLCILYAQCGHCVQNHMYNFLFGINTTCALAFTSLFQLVVQLIGNPVEFGFRALAMYSGLMTLICIYMALSHFSEYGSFTFERTHANVNYPAMQALIASEDVEDDIQNEVEIMSLQHHPYDPQ